MARRHLVLLIGAAAVLTSPVAFLQAQQNCQDTPEGRICRVQQPIVAGVDTSIALQKQLGLVTVNGNCSGTLLNRWWVLTARHCVQTNNTVSPTVPLLPADQVSVTARWAPDRSGAPSRFVELGGANRRDIILIYLGRADLGEVDRQWVYGLRLQTTDTVTQYGQGLATFATGGVAGVPLVLGGGGGVYRSGQFRPSNITDTSYDLAMNTGQVGHGGDSGGPSVVTVNGAGVGIAGVQSTCNWTALAPGAPAANVWPWARGITQCGYVSVEPVVQEIRRAIRETPLCSPRPACLMTSIIEHVLKQ